MIPYRKTCIVISIVLLSMSCGKPKTPKSSKTVEDVTGITAVKKGEQIKKQLKDVEKAQAEREKELDEIK